MLAALLANWPEWGSKSKKPSHGWLTQQQENAKLAQDDEDILAFIINVVTSEVLNDQSM